MLDPVDGPCEGCRAVLAEGVGRGDGDRGGDRGVCPVAGRSGDQAGGADGQALRQAGGLVFKGSPKVDLAVICKLSGYPL